MIEKKVQEQEARMRLASTEIKFMLTLAKWESETRIGMAELDGLWRKANVGGGGGDQDLKEKD